MKKNLVSVFLIIFILIGTISVSNVMGVTQRNITTKSSTYSGTSLTDMRNRAEAIVNYEWIPQNDIATWNYSQRDNGTTFFFTGETVKGVPYTQHNGNSLEQYKNLTSENRTYNAGPLYGSCCADFVCEVFGGDFMDGNNVKYRQVWQFMDSTYTETSYDQTIDKIKPGDALIWINDNDQERKHIIWVGDVTDTTITIYEQTPPVARKVIADKVTDSNGYFKYADLVYRIITRSKAFSDVPTFSDVPSDAYYSSAVQWAAENDITNGTGDGKFNPDKTCTRGEALTFLWRVAGRPKLITKNPFKDVKSNEYYYNAVLWAYKKGIAKGTGNNKFSPDKTCTRAEIITFLWRYVWKCVWRYDEEPSQSPPIGISIDDVQDKEKYYYNAVMWGVKNSIIDGKTHIHCIDYDINGKITERIKFNPDDNCTRAEIVTFLYRYVKPSKHTKKG